MKVYSILDYRDNHPLYVCSSKIVAEQLQKKLKIFGYIQETLFVEEATLEAVCKQM